MLRMCLREEPDASFGIGSQAQTTLDRPIKEVLDIVLERRLLELVLCQARQPALGNLQHELNRMTEQKIPWP